MKCVDDIKEISNKRKDSETLKTPLDKTSDMTNEVFMFTSLPVELKKDNIFGNQMGLVFMEKNMHLELNQYIQKHITYLKAMFRKNGYVFIYLPAHYADNHDNCDVIGAYCDESDAVLGSSKQDKTESTYWNEMIFKDKLPEDCTGFLHYLPQSELQRREKKIYDYILFPSQAGTDWERAFSCLMDYVATSPKLKVNKEKLLPLGVTILIDEKYNIFLTDFHVKIAEIKMPVLSKVLYFTFLQHSNGIAQKELIDYKGEMVEWYKKLSNRKDIEKSIDDLVDPTNNSANEKISRMRKAFAEALYEYSDKIDKFVPMGRKGEKYVVAFDRNRVIWK